MTRSTPPTFDGLLLIDKPVGISSFDVIRRLRSITGWRKIGHAGTLDPAASGLMLMLFGAACKQAQVFSKLDKRYLAEITLGINSSTGDREGQLMMISDVRPDAQAIESALKELTGEITQIPSAYSAIKINGQEAYKRVRAGEDVEMPSRQVTIYSNELINYVYPKLNVNVRVSSGTYIRSLAQDLGEQLETGAYLSALTRTEVGDLSLDNALKLEGLTAAEVLTQLK